MLKIYKTKTEHLCSLYYYYYIINVVVSRKYPKIFSSVFFDWCSSLNVKEVQILANN